jgi:hypothetical protein
MGEDATCSTTVGGHARVCRPAAPSPNLGRSLASGYLGLLFWGSAAAIELTALATSLSRSVHM